MSFTVRFTAGAEADLIRLYQFILDRDPIDFDLAERVLDGVKHAIRTLELSPFNCRMVRRDNPLLRELVIPFGATGYVALFEIESNAMITVLAVRHQREDDYY